MNDRDATSAPRLREFFMLAECFIEERCFDRIRGTDALQRFNCYLVGWNQNRRIISSFKETIGIRLNRLINVKSDTFSIFCIVKLWRVYKNVDSTPPSKS